MGDTILVRLRAIGAARFKRDMNEAGDATAALEPKGRAAGRGLEALASGSTSAAGGLRALALVALVVGGVQGIGLLITAVTSAIGVLAGLGSAAAGTAGVLALFSAGAQAYFKDMSKVSGSTAADLADNFNYLKAQAAQAFGPAFDAVFRGLSRAITPLGGLIRAVAPAVVQLGGVIGEAIGKVAEIFRSFGPQFAQLIRGTGAVVQALVPLFGELLRLFLAAAQAGLPYLITGIQRLTTALRGVSSDDVAGYIARSFQTMGSVFRTVVGIVRLVAPVFSALRQAIVQIANAALPGLTRGIEALGPAFQAILASGALTTLAGAVGDTFAAVATVIGTVTTKLQQLGLLKPVIVGLTAAFVAYKIAVVAAGIATAVAASPVALIIGAIAALAVGVIYAYRRFDGFRNAVDGAWNVIKGVANWIRNNWQVAVGALTGPVGLAVGFIVRHFGSIKGVVIGVAKAIVAPFKAAFNGIATIWNSTIGQLSFKIPGWVPKIGGMGFDVPDIPMLATGGTVLSGGAAIVGERGEELVTLPSGATVHPHNSWQTQAAMGRTSSPFDRPVRQAAGAGQRVVRVTVPLAVSGRVLAEAVGEVILDNEAGVPA